MPDRLAFSLAITHQRLTSGCSVNKVTEEGSQLDLFSIDTNSYLAGYVRHASTLHLEPAAGNR